MTALLVTGGTGSFGRAFIRRALTDPTVDRVVVFSRDELKQHEMRLELPDERLRWFIGDVRDRDRLRRAMRGVDSVVHAAALKQVPACEYNPLEAVKTNVAGTSNVIDAALDAGVSRVLALGTDKAVDPTNLYGATKLVAEKLVVDANVYSGASGTRFAGTRYGNVLSSRGSVLPLWLAQHQAGARLTVTDPSMTRFVLRLEDGVEFVRRCLDSMQGGEVFVPKLRAVSLDTIAAAVSWPDRPRFKAVGVRPGEKRHELLVSSNEAHRTRDCGWCYLVTPLYDLPSGVEWGGERVHEPFWFGSDSADLLNVHEFRQLAGLESTLFEAAS